MKKAILSFFTCCIIFQSCGDCPDDIVIEQFLLLDESLAFVNYSEGDEITIYNDQDGNEYGLTVKTDIDRDTRIELTELCNEGRFDQQHEVLITDSRFVSLTNALETSEIEVSQFVRRDTVDNLDSMFLYDQLNISARVTLKNNKEIQGSLALITGIHQNEITSQVLDFNNYGRLIQDTTILGVQYQDVYTSNLSFDTQSELYYNIDDGIVLLKLDDENFLTF